MLHTFFFFRLKTISGSGWLPFFLVLLFYQAGVSKTFKQSQIHSTTTEEYEATDMNAVVGRDFTLQDNATTVNTSKTNAENITGYPTRLADTNPRMNNIEGFAETKSDRITKSEFKSASTQPTVRSVPEETDSRAINPEVNETTTSAGQVVFVIQPDIGIETVNLPVKTVIAKKKIPVTSKDRQSDRSNNRGQLGHSPTLTTSAPHFKDSTEKFKDGILSTEELKYLTGYIEKLHNIEIDFANLLTQYELVCPTRGDCNILSIGTSGYTSSLYHHLCPRNCECDFRCVTRGNCCPGNIYAYTDQDCVNVQVYPPDDQISYHMITTCPSQYSEHNIIKGCESQPINQSNVQPVTSYDTSLSYKNRFCAQCHRDENITEWKISVQCPSLYVLNDNFDSFSNLKEEIRKQNCKILFDLDDYNLKPINCQNYQPASNLVDKCNVTGLWYTGDSDINWACEHYNGKAFSNFKNVFCYICNPSIISVSSPLTIDKCNISEEWTHFDPLIESACLTQPAIKRLYPYKNVYCLICNGVSSLWPLFPNSFSTNKMKISFDEQLYDKERLLSYLTIGVNFYGENKISDLAEFIENMYEGAIMNNSFYVETLKGIAKTSEQMDKQFDDYISICGKHQTCNLSSYNESFYGLSNPVCRGTSGCSCKENCVESGTCCVDFILKNRPYSCYNKSTILHFTPGTNLEKGLELEEDNIPCHTLIDKCTNQQNTTVGLTKDHLKLLSVLPVRYNGQIAYRNISYLLCNVEEAQNIRIDISVKCGSFFEKSLITWQTMLPTLNNATKQFCAGTFIGRTRDEEVHNIHWEYVRKQPRTKLGSDLEALNIPSSILTDDDYRIGNATEFTSCNQTGKWSARDVDVLSVCENSEHLGPSFPGYRINGLLYKNYACYICNPEIDESEFTKDDVISTCNETGLVDLNEVQLNEIEVLCQETEPHTRWLPFKNYYCSRCNIPAAGLVSVFLLF